MIKRLVWNDIKKNKLSSIAVVFFMAVSAMLLALTVLLFLNLVSAIDFLMDKAKVPDYMQMYTDGKAASEFEDASFDTWMSDISRFVKEHKEVSQWQVCRFLNLDNSRIRLGGLNLAGSTQDNGLCVQGKQFDYLLDTGNKIPEVLPGEVYVPVCYRNQYDLSAGDSMIIENAFVKGDRGVSGTVSGTESLELVIAGFIRDAQMNSMMASSKRFLVNEEDYRRIRRFNHVQEEYLIEFLLKEGTDINLFAASYSSAELPANGPAITRTLVRMMNALSDGTMIFILFLVSIVVLLISMLCIRFMCLAQMERERKEAGMLKALGIGRRQIRQIYFAKYLIFSGCGALTGLLAAGILKVPLARQLQELYGTSADSSKTVVLSFFAVFLTEGIILFSIGDSLKKVEKLSALEALFLNREKKAGAGQYFLIGFVSAACTFLALIPHNLYRTMSDTEFVTYMGIGDGEIRLDIRQMEDIDRATEQIAMALKQDIQVEKYVELRTRSCPMVLPDGQRVYLSVETGDHSIFPIDMQEGTLPKAQGEIALSAINAEELGMNVGDTVCLIVDGDETEYVVCGIYSDITNGGKTAKAYNISGGAESVWSVLYVSLKESTEKEQWMERYRKMGAGVTDIADYVRDTYGQTLSQLYLSSRLAKAIAILVIVIVTVLFMRLIVEENRYTISLHKALGFTSKEIKKVYFVKGFIPVAAGIIAGLLIGNLSGESLCGMALKFFGADGFRFVVSWGQVILWTLVYLSGPAAAAVLAGIAEIGKVKAYECCNRYE